ncbi:MAG: hypothetical protein ACFFBD_09995 [Candidatus Hodarchaeota archaeon]
MPEPFSEEARQKCARELANGQKLLQSYLNEIRNSSKSLEEGAKTLKDTEQDFLNQGVENIARKGKLFMQSLRALGDLADKVTVAAETIDIPEHNDLSYDELKNLNRHLGKILGTIRKDLGTASQIMGLDFTMVRRRVSSPYKRLYSFNEKIRDLLGQEYEAVRIIENLKRLETEVAENEDEIADLEAQIEELERTQQELEQNLEEKEEFHAELEQNEAMQSIRNLIVKAKSFDLKISKKVNPLRKLFRKYVQLSERGEITVPFDLINAARNYEKDALDEILKEQEGQPDLLRLLESMQGLANQNTLKGKATNRIKNAIDSIKSGKVEEWKQRYLELNKELEEEKKKPELQSIVQDIEQTGSVQKNLKGKLEETKDVLKVTRRKKDKSEESLEEKLDNVKKLMKALENHY